MTQINKNLPYKLIFQELSTQALGEFQPGRWVLGINYELLSPTTKSSTVGGLNQNEVAEIVNTIYHEIRHSEQYFRVARMLSGKGKRTEQIAQQMKIPQSIAELAVKQPLIDNSKTKAELQEAKVWESFLVGKYKDYSDRITVLSTLLERIRAKWNISRSLPNKQIANIPHFAEDQKKESSYSPSEKLMDISSAADYSETSLKIFFNPFMEELKKDVASDVFVTSIIQRIKQINETVAEVNKAMSDISGQTISNNNIKIPEKAAINLFDIIFSAYTNLPEEKDADKLGKAAAKAFNNQARRNEK